MLKKLFLLSFLTVIFLQCAFAQSDSRNVLQSDISGAYKKTVKTSFYNELNENYGLTKGYHGMMDFGYTAGGGDYDLGRMEINTAHGYQFNPYFFLGGGLGLHFMNKYSGSHNSVPCYYRSRFLDVPLFMNVRVTFLKKSITPCVDGRAGYYLTHHGGLYAGISAGCRFAIWDRQAVSISIGYTHGNLQYRIFDHYISGTDEYSRYNHNLDSNGINFRINYEF